MTDLSRKTVRELLSNPNDVSPSQWARRIDAAIARDERLTRKLADYQVWRDRWIESLPLRAAAEFDNIHGDTP